MRTRPLVGVIACRREVEGHPAHMVTDKYLSALRDYGLAPVILPVWEDAVESELLTSLDGLLLTGSYTNVEPQRYGAKRAPENTRGDPHRDAAALSWIPAALDLGLPLFAICRGCQELNVAFGGTLHQALQQVPGMLDHREPQGDRDAKYAPAHELTILPGGRLSALYGASVSWVNSLHQQGIAELGPGLVAEAVAPDGLVEAISVTGAPGFALAVQWHPEWKPREHPLYDALFRAFAAACGVYRGARLSSTSVGA
ncbi:MULTISPECIES: gamma-glutamyl-gamma-aminobutyrate hydrolase family protein [Halomonas]|uniref:gamma-glutamyl-gamma-aminobutyrate hydrolase n=1 Tax=Halomonas ventosae TaxID=229007 RepID=A0A4R6HVQ6_9GAMM|nr:gamma-glutamyl-gamma-aminobutyrate hydrolase family protein [Halomonas ventosae]TDO12525.1 gamma-glutamyl-gamma-aminobutyrate hydrolase [Halomonas ventosae]